MKQVQEWLKTTPYKDYTLSIASADASFRKYYRLHHQEQTVLLMDSSLEKDSLSPFLDVTKRLAEAGVRVPKILATYLEKGYLIIEDFGDTHYLNKLNKKNFVALYKDAIDEIVKMQKASTKELPLYDKEFLHFEMNLIKDWYIKHYLKKELTQEQTKILEDGLNIISNEVLQQPQNLFVHRDFHSRNIMITTQDDVGIIDYQDAMSGALCYDLVSLLKDCYIEFPRNDIEQLALYFKEKTKIDVDDATFLRWFDFMGLQRHIKVLGIFARLFYRDNKDGYLKDIPLTLHYTLTTAKRYKELQPLAKLLGELQD